MGIFSRDNKSKEDREAARVKARDIANSLLSYKPFVEWAGDVMVRNGFFDSRELTPYCQGVRGGIVKEIEKLMETADDGDKFLANVFKNNVLSGRKR